MRLNVKKFLPEITVAVVSGLFFLYLLSTSFAYESDLGRDSLAMWKILHGHLTLLGPKTSFGGLYVGPYYFYIFAPFLAMAHFHPVGIAIGNALLSVVCCTLIFHLLRRKTSLMFASLSISWIIITPYFLMSARVVTNASTYIAPLFLYLVLLIFYYPFKKNELLSLLFFGFGAGLIANIHPVSLLVSIPFTAGVFILRRQPEFFKKMASYFIGFIAAFGPIALFEVTHGFIMTKNTFLNRSFELFTKRQNAVVNVVTSNNVVTNIFNINNTTSAWIHPSLIQILVAMFILVFLLRRQKHIVLIGVLFLANVFFYSLLFRFQAVDYYLFPLLVLAQVVFIYILSFASSVIKYGLLAIFILFSLLSFPRSFYSASPRSYNKIYNQTKSAAQELKLPSSGFNVVNIRETPIGILGQEYRYTLKTLGYSADDIFNYVGSQYLIMVSEKGPLDWEHETSWEIDQFGQKQLLKTVTTGGTVWYLFIKK